MIYALGIQMQPGLDIGEDRPGTFRAWVELLLRLKNYRVQRSAWTGPDAHYDAAIPEWNTTASPLTQAAVFIGAIWLEVDEKAATAMLADCYPDGPVTRQDIQAMIMKLTRVRNYTLCIIDDGKMLAVANYWCRQGDEVYVFPGTDTPFVVRKELNGDCYRLVCPIIVERLRMIGYQKWRAKGDDLRDITLI